MPCPSCRRRSGLNRFFGHPRDNHRAVGQRLVDLPNLLQLGISPLPAQGICRACRRQAPMDHPRKGFDPGTAQLGPQLRRFQDRGGLRQRDEYHCGVVGIPQPHQRRGHDPTPQRPDQLAMIRPVASRSNSVCPVGAVSITTMTRCASETNRAKAWKTATSSVQGECRSSSRKASPWASNVGAAFSRARCR